MEKRLLKLSISRFFRSSLRSCQSQAISDVAQEPVFLPRDSHHRSFPSIRQPMYAEMTLRSKTKSENKRSPPPATRLYDAEGRRCPPPSPASPFHEVEKKMKKNKKKTKKEKAAKAKKSKDHEENIRKIKGKEVVLDPTGLSISSDSRRFFSSDEDTLKDTAAYFYFSDSSSSSSSFESQRRRPRPRRKVRSQTPDVGVRPLDPAPSAKKTRKVQESVAVVKSSDNPYGDFRRSMVEMILEKQIYTAAGLEELLECFLSLNSPFHHQVIVEVFSEILETMFPNLY
ncbi:hypothetical protein ACLOJK_040288 [Asimina triloba]